MSKHNFYGRSYHLTLTDERTANKKVFTELDIKFSIKKIVFPCRYTAKISILGLPWTEMNDIAATSIYDAPTAARKFRKRVSLTAGYINRETEIFSGYIVMASIQRPPEMWLDMTVVNFIDNLDGNVNLSWKDGMTAKMILDETAKKMNIPVAYKYSGLDAINNELGPTVINGGWLSVFQKLDKLANWNVYYDNGFIFVVDQPFKTRYNENPRTINQENGLLKVKNVDLIGCSVQTYLDSTASMSAYMNVDSQLMPVANGKYWINSITHEGHFRGNEWFTTYDGIRRKEKETR